MSITTGRGKLNRQVKAAQQKVGSLLRIDRLAEPNAIVGISSVPNDPGFPSQWSLNNTGQTGGTADADIDAPEAWDTTIGSPNVVVGVIDTGVDLSHPDLAANIWTNPLEIPGDGIDNDANGYVDDVHGWDFYNTDNDPFDDHGHGTHVAGIIAASGNNNLGIAGVSQRAKILAIKAFGPDGFGLTADCVNAVNYATALKMRGENVRVINNSWGGGGYSQALHDPIAASGAANMLFVAAAGNSSTNTDTTPFYPASYDLTNIISVAATDQNDQLAVFSNIGKTSVDLAAPGTDIYITTNNISEWKILFSAPLDGSSAANTDLKVNGKSPDFGSWTGANQASFAFYLRARASHHRYNCPRRASSAGLGSRERHG